MEYTEKIIHKRFYKIDGNKVKVARAERGWTISKLASESGVTRKTITEIERGNKKRIRPSTMHQIALTLGKQLDYFCIHIEKSVEGNLDEY